MRSPRIGLIDRFLAAALAVILVFGMLPATALALQAGNPESSSGQIVPGGDDEGYQTISGGDAAEDDVVYDGEAGVEAADDEMDEPETDGGDSGNGESEGDGPECDGPAEVMITVSVTGLGKVELFKEEENILTASGESNENSIVKVHVEDEIKVVVTPEDGISRIGSISIRGVEELPVDTKSPYETKEPLAVSEDDIGDVITIAASFINYYTVYYTANAGGTVDLKKAGAEGEDTAGTDELAAADVEEERGTSGELEVDEGEAVSLTVTPDSENQYRIASVTVGGVTEEISDTRSGFVKEINIGQDTEINVDFEKYYIVKVACEGNGSVTVNSDDKIPGEGGTVTITGDNTIVVEATPYDNYRVSAVTINDVRDGSIKGENSESWRKELDGGKNYMVEITFSPNRYKITVTTPENGQIAIQGGNEINYGESLDFTVTADAGYNIASITKNGMEVGGDKVERTSDTSVSVMLGAEDIANDFTLEAAFEPIPAMSISRKDLEDKDVAITGLNLALNSDVDKELYIFGKDVSVTFSVSEGGIAIGELQENGKCFDSDTLRLTGAGAVSSIAIYKSDEKYGQWSVLNLDKPIQIIIDNQAPDVDFQPEDANENGYYSKDVTVTVVVTEPSAIKNERAYSGLQSVTYKIEAKGVDDTAEGSIFSAGQVKAGGDDQGVEDAEESEALDDEDTSAEVTYQVTGTITIDAETFNSEKVTVSVTAADNAGNTSTKEIDLKINSTAPTISVFLDGEEAVGAQEGYYNKTRKAAIKVKDRTDTFDEENLKAGISITGRDVIGNPVVEETDLLADAELSGSNGTYTLTFDFDIDANYVWSVVYTNKAGLSCSAGPEVSGGVSQTQNDFEFTVDRTPPKGKITVEEKIWEKLLSELTFGFWRNYSVNVTAEGADDTSPTYGIKYLKERGTTDGILFTAAQLDQKEFTESAISLQPDESAVVYAKITDYAGNTTYVSTGGIIVENDSSRITLTPDKTNEYVEGKYNGDVSVDIYVTDKPEEGEIYSGIKSISYQIFCDNQVTGEGTLYTFTETDPTYGQLISEWSQEKAIAVDAEINNSSEVKVTVTVTDNAGNTMEETLNLDINSSRPQAKIRFEDEAYSIDEEGRGYFGHARIAHITITDREDSFDPDAVQLTFSAVDGVGKKVDLGEGDVVVSKWSPEGDEHSAAIEFLRDGNYKWSISYTNKAGKTMDSDQDIDTGESVTPFCFTVDTNAPEDISISVKQKFWDYLLEKITFGLYHSDSVEVEAKAKDIMSPFVLEYYIAVGREAITRLNDDVLEQKEFMIYEDKFEISPDTTFVIYLRAVDYAGNRVYRLTDGCIVDATASTIGFAPGGAAPGTYKYFNQSTVNVAVTVNDDVDRSGEKYSGINKVEYWVIKDGDEENPTQSGVLYSFEAQHPDASDISYEDLLPKRTWNVPVNSALNNSCDVVVRVRTEDNAGNETIETVSLDIDVTAPQIRISFDNNSDNGGNTYFNAERTATIVITERMDHFEADAATSGVRNHIKAVDADGTPVSNAYVFSGWVTEVNSENPDLTTHTATVRFVEDANYTFAPAYTDKAGNAGSVSYAQGTVAARAFTIDTHVPTGTVKAVSGEGRSTEWSMLLRSLNFGYWSRSGITITASSQDATSPVVKTQYYKVSSQNTPGVAAVLSAEQLDQVSAWTDLGTGLRVGNSEKFVVYIKLEDAAGNHTYLCTDGLMVDADAPVLETVEPSVTIQTTQNNSDLYNGDVEVSISVTDPLVGGTYSGLRNVTYTVTSLGTVTGSETLFSFDMENPTESDLVQTWDGSVTVSAQDNNSNEVVFEVFAEDNSGNSVTRDVTFRIDVTPPEINVSYNNNSAENDSYFNEDRTATITVRERNFQAENVTVEITNTEEVIPVISDWSSSPGSGNGDDTIWTATITYSADGDYTFNVTCTDMAGNEAEEPLYGDSVMPTEFTIDKTLPVISVSYDNNESANDRYFNAGRVATVTVEEHNFLEELVTFTQTAALEGGTAAVPAVSWTNNGDIHIATLIYDTDGDYTFDVEAADMAGNRSEGADYGNSVAGESFTIDQNIEKPVIRGVENGGAYKDEVVLEINFGDVNYASCDIQLLRTRRDEKDVDVTSQFITGIVETLRGGSGTYDTFERIVDNDGIYALNVQVTDMAGNEETETVVFTVNRFGSVYVYDDYLISLIADGGAYVQAVTNDLVITEYNADRLEEGFLNIEITLDGRPLDQAAYNVSPVMNEQTQVGDSGWFQYRYTISKDNFSTDGVYKISVSSRDAAGNTPESTPENSVDISGSSIVDTIQFKVDSTPPEINSIVGLEESIINANEVAVRYTVFDTIGLSAVTVYLNGKRLEDSVTDFGEDINNFSGSFVIGENTQAQTVRIVAEDLAGNVKDTDAEDFSSAYSFNRSVTVSTNVFVRWYANKPLFYGSIGGAGTVGGGSWTALALRRRRKLLKVK